MLKYAITSGESWTSLGHVRRWPHEGVEFVQLREKQLAAEELERLAAAMVAGLRAAGGGTKLLVNGLAEIALAAGADGVHLASHRIEEAGEVRAAFRAAGVGEPVVSASCHTVKEVRRAVAGGVDLILFGPVFEKRVEGGVVVAGVGLERLREVCAAAAGGTRVLALGGVSWESAPLCVEAGAAGVAGIRLFGGETTKE